ncbi:3-hydroxyisobutyrate dehydrogenase [Venturia nashicola]|uniref:3-hydroxyisobutyrate dehydrogenase n=1 Tax=Venturia nashicola TaxID=86259 RepID=A0A4Z1PSZ4_9PEZI|nr:3-hydroxyisobutyrate dehydrogenase [Venturia nashicola]
MRLATGLASSSYRVANAARSQFASRRFFSSTTSQQATWGFIGLGQMGYRMAKNLREKIPADDVLMVQDVNKDAVKRFVKELSGFHVIASESARAIAEQSSTIITALPEPQHVKGVYRAMLEGLNLNETGLEQERLFLDTSTIDPMTSGEVSRSITSTGQGKFIDAPMSGGVVGAGAGTLTFMIGGPENLIPRATEVLSMMGKRVLHMGAQGAGLKAKLANNYLLALNNIATCEAMHMGVQWGLDPKALAGMINTATGKCWPSEVNNPVPGVIETSPASRDYDGGFGVSLMSKDLRLALAACDEFGIKNRMGPVAKQIYDEVQADAKLKGKDFSVVYRYMGGKE